MMNKTTVSTLIAATLLAAGFSASVSAHQAGDIIVRAGAVVVAPNESSDDVVIPGKNLGEFQVSNNTQLGLNFGYMLTDNIGIELLAATPFSHDVSLNGVGKIAETKHLPPTLVAQYYFGDAQSTLRPYIGVGVNYTNFFDNEFTNDLGGALTDLSMSTSWGLAAQAGIDYQVNKNWLVNASVWYAQIDSDVKFKFQGAPVTISTDINPWVYMISVGYSF
ncbi:outer membrane protein OmpW [Shewanella xiamenensis]|uniref:Outer membrane protein W n=1 Tax=Shewanella decolorationis TaxID=256839 RepID=A0A5B8R0A2_9GAMM|nr:MULTISPECIES: outer membrane protein OmpW [Shewanella]MDH1313137.1 outer membrane protein OmpW [Shewanella xiamenensis]ODR86595.1 membrane protein [Shewanella xiamenensis]QDZ91616.2 outer membrane protein OmpW [Shewanella decolorationis]